MWMIILQSCIGTIIREEWGSEKPKSGNIDCAEEYWSKELGQSMVVVNIYFVEE